MIARYTFPAEDAPRFTVPRSLIERMARAIHIAHYEENGARYAEPEEMKMHMDDPCACWELVRDDIQRALGGEFVSCDFETFTFYELFTTEA